MFSSNLTLITCRENCNPPHKTSNMRRRWVWINQPHWGSTPTQKATHCTKI